MSAIGEGDCREGAWASNRFGRLRCLRSTAPKGARQDDSGEQRKGNYFHFVGAGAETDPEEEDEGGGSMGPCLSHGVPVLAYPLGHQPGTPCGLERAILNWPIFPLKGLLIVKRLHWPQGPIRLKNVLHREATKFYFVLETFSFTRPS